MVTDNLIKRTLLALVDAQIRFVVCGGVACILQGVPRATHDLDIRVVLESPDLDKLVVVIRSLGLLPRIPEPVEALLALLHGWSPSHAGQKHRRSHV